MFNSNSLTLLVIVAFTLHPASSENPCITEMENKMHGCLAINDPAATKYSNEYFKDNKGGNVTFCGLMEHRMMDVSNCLKELSTKFDADNCTSQMDLLKEASEHMKCDCSIYLPSVALMMLSLFTVHWNVKKNLVV